MNPFWIGWIIIVGFIAVTTNDIRENRKDWWRAFFLRCTTIFVAVVICQIIQIGTHRGRMNNRAICMKRFCFLLFALFECAPLLWLSSCAVANYSRGETKNGSEKQWRLKATLIPFYAHFEIPFNGAYLGAIPAPDTIPFTKNGSVQTFCWSGNLQRLRQIQTALLMTGVVLDISMYELNP